MRAFFCWVLKSWVSHVTLRTLRTLPSCPRLTPTLHSTIGLIAGSATASLLPQLEASQGGFLHFNERTFFNSVNTFINNNHMWYLFLIWWHLTILRWTGVINYKHNVTFNFKLQMIVHAPMFFFYHLLKLLFGAPGSETLNMRVRRIYCLNNLGSVPLASRK